MFGHMFESHNEIHVADLLILGHFRFLQRGFVVVASLIYSPSVTLNSLGLVKAANSNKLQLLN